MRQFHSISIIALYAAQLVGITGCNKVEDSSEGGDRSYGTIEIRGLPDGGDSARSYTESPAHFAHRQLL